MRIASTREMGTGGERRPLTSVLTEMGQPLALVSRTDGRLLYANPACERLFGYGPGALGDHHLSELSAAPARSPGDRAHTISREIATTGVWSGETEGVRADGTTFPCLVSLSEIDGADPGSRVWVAVFLAGTHTQAASADQRLRLSFDPARAVALPFVINARSRRPR